MGHNLVTAGLGYGDEGKGTVTEYLARTHNARLVVRYNGGHQAAHNVVLADGRHHTFAQYGSATLQGIPTHLSRFMVVNPLALVRENVVLRGTMDNEVPKLTIEGDCLFTTPFHRAANRIREYLRGKDRHGSCGVGIAETKKYAEEFPDSAPRIHDLESSLGLTCKLIDVQHHYYDEFFGGRSCDCAELTTLAKPLFWGREDLIVYVSELLDTVKHFNIVDSDWLTTELNKDGTVIFEGAQGILLDERHGFHPFCTWSNCTFQNAFDLIGISPRRSIDTYGVLRTYAHRHGPGPLVTEDRSLEIPEPHNGTGRWQGDFRRGHFDAVTAGYAVDVLQPMNIVLTHCDWLRDKERVKLCQEYRLDGETVEISPQSAHDMLRATPQYSKDIPAGEFIDLLRTALCDDIEITSYGPQFEDKRHG